MSAFNYARARAQTLVKSIEVVDLPGTHAAAARRG
jgi:hypothetical protein